MADVQAVSMVGGTIRRKLIHRENFRASVLHHSEKQSGEKPLRGSFVPWQRLRSYRRPPRSPWLRMCGPPAKLGI